MLTKEHVIKKLNTLPEDILEEVDDFIEFLEAKSKKNKEIWYWPAMNRDKIEESDFSDYLEGLTNYEDMLAEGKIRWK